MTVSDNTDGNFPRPLTKQDEFFRAIHPDFIKSNGTVSSGGFSKSNSDKTMSMDWGEKSTPKETYDRWEKWGDCRGLVSLTAKMCWDNKQIIIFDSIKDVPDQEDNPAHSLMAGKVPPQIGEKKLRKNLSRSAKVLVTADQSI